MTFLPVPHRLRAAVAIALLALCGGGGHAQAPAPPPASFAGQIAALSEPEGYFDTDNLISNEQGYLTVLQDYRPRGLPGRSLRRGRAGPELLLHRRRPARRRVHHRRPAGQSAAPSSLQGALLARAHADGVPRSAVRARSAKGAGPLAVQECRRPDRLRRWGASRSIERRSTHFALASRRRCDRSASR